MTIVLIFPIVLYTGPVHSQAAPYPPAANLVLPPGTSRIPFLWKADSVNAKWEPHTAMLIPVKLKHCPALFFMQFDLGSPYSVLYKNKLAAIQAQYPAAISLQENAGSLLNFSFRAGAVPVLANEIAVKQFDSSALDWNNKKSMEVIGTIGADLIDGKTVIIDYPGRQLIISAAIPAKRMKGLTLSSFIYAGKKILLPAKVQGKETLLYFDTGSSMYELLTDKTTCLSLALPGSEFVQSRVRSWDKYLTANSIAANGSIETGGKTIPIQYATFIEGTSTAQVEQMKKTGIGGMTGNKIFLNYKLVIDTKNKKFGLIGSRNF